ncbi:MAG: methyltransferase domain-containing protein [Planctomycetota bacterium]
MKRGRMQSKEWYEKWYSGKEKIFAWNKGKPHSGLVEIVDNGVLKSRRVLVPGCGMGYDAIFLAERGFEVVAFDFSVNAIEKAKLKAKVKGQLKGRVQFAVEDIYDLPESYGNAFDCIVEIGNFQAMGVKERRDYVKVITWVLREGGQCVAICKKYPPLTPGPKGLKKASLRSYFSGGFEVERIEPVIMYRKGPPPDGLRLLARKRGQS